MDLIYYHGHCTDGWAAAYIAHLKYPEAKLVPAHYSTEPPYEDVEGKDVLMVDFAWKGRDVNIKLNLLAKSLRIFEHHKTVKEVLDGLEFVTFDIARSGAGITWDYLFGCDSTRVGDGLWEPRPWWVNYVEDYDIWTKKLPMIEEVSAFLHNSVKTIEAWDGIAMMEFSQAVSMGMGAWRQIQYQTEALVKVANSGQGWGCSVAVVNGPFFTTSEVGAELAKTHDIALIWSIRKDGKMAVGLRSQGDIDVSKVASRFGGGGHKNSAGFEIEAQRGYALIESILKPGPFPTERTNGHCAQ